MRIHYSLFKSAFLPVGILILTLYLISIPGNANAQDNSSPSDNRNITIVIPAFSMKPVAFELGALLQTDYRYYAETERADNRFLIRRAQLEMTSQIQSWLKFNFEYEFKDNTNDHLQDTYAEISFKPTTIRIGHFKEPFSLQWQTKDDSIYFAERAMGYFLSPNRETGIMFKRPFFNEHMFFAGGLFNAEGDNVANRSNGKDDPEIAGRMIFFPFVHLSNTALKNFQFGASGSYAKINISNLDFAVKTSGMIDTTRNIYVLSHDTKFGVLQDVDARWRAGVEAAWAYRTLALQAEYFKLTYTSLEPVGKPAQDADFSSWYVSALWFLTGEQPEFNGGGMKPIRPNRSFDPAAGTFGALAVAARIDRFNGDRDWITPDANVSVDHATAYSIALNWQLLPMHRILLDYTYTDLSDPIRVRVQPDGSVEFINKENAITLRYSVDL